MTILASGTGSEVDLSRFCREDVLPSLSRIEGVAGAAINGEVNEVLEIQADISKLNSLEISLTDIYSLLKSSNLSVPGGDVVFRNYNLNIRTDGRFSSVREVENLVIAFKEQTPIYLKDVAAVSIKREKPESYVISNGREALSLTLDKKKAGDAIAISREVKAILKDFERENQGAYAFEVLIEDSDKIDAAVGSVVDSAVLGAVLAVLILFLFLHNWRTTVIVAVSIPLSLLFTMIAMKVKGMTINMITLGGMTTAIGMIVDSSIVVLENIYRHLKEGMGVKEAASLGSREVGGAVVASTSTSLAVFIPILFLSGLTGLILQDVAWTILFSLFSSMLVAIMVVPFLSSLLLKPIPQRMGEGVGGAGPLHIRAGRRVENGIDWISRGYYRGLHRVLESRLFFIGIAAALLVLSVLSFRLLGFEFLEQTDMAEIQITIETPGGYTLDMTREKVLVIEALIKKVVPEYKTGVYFVGRGGNMASGYEPNKAFGTISLSGVETRNRHVMEIIPVINEAVAREIPDVDVSVANGGVSAKMALATGGEGFIVEVYGSSMDKVIAGAETARQLMAAESQCERY